MAVSITSASQVGCFTTEDRDNLNTNDTNLKSAADTNSSAVTAWQTLPATAPIDVTKITYVGEQVTVGTLAGTADAVPQHTAKTYLITGTAIDHMTIAAPTATTDDGVVIRLISAGDYAHDITGTNILNAGSASGKSVLTFGAHAGASLTLMAYQAAWYVIAAQAITVSS